MTSEESWLILQIRIQEHNEICLRVKSGQWKWNKEIVNCWWFRQFCLPEAGKLHVIVNVKGQRNLEKCKLLQDVTGMKRMWDITYIQVWYQMKAESDTERIFSGQEALWLVWRNVQFKMKAR